VQVAAGHDPADRAIDPLNWYVPVPQPNTDSECPGTSRSILEPKAPPRHDWPDVADVLLVKSVSMAATIRHAQLGDGDAITHAWLSAGQYYAGIDPGRFQVPQTEGGAHFWDDHIRQCPANSLCLVADMDGRVIGFLTARLILPEPDAAAQFTRDQGRTRLAVDALVVMKENWRHGAGAALLEAAESWGRAKGAEIVTLDTYAHSPVSIPFYEQRMGYQRRGIVFDKPL
jgi:GNAT superfamily N-acetyltransferase